LPHVQYAALPYRVSKAGALEILLVTSRETKRWIIPKGWPIKGLTPAVAAAREAYEESGARGAVSPKPFGTFSYEKLVDPTSKPASIEVTVFPLLVRKQARRWPEQDMRKTRWFSRSEALSVVGEESLRRLLDAFEPAASARSPSKKARSHRG
jgi:8-oxo-dGTP pyrophosphatase MutT (NUDIX family)